MFIDGIRSFAVAGLAAAFLLAGAAAVQAQTAEEWTQAETDCENDFNDSPAANSCTFTSVSVSSSVVIVNGVPDNSTRTWECEITASCTIEQDDGTSQTVTLARGIPLSKVSDTTLATDSQGQKILSYPGASND
ncbi:MAG: hypothetical protein OXC10_19005 [Rhodospirillaceae bacterium]|nr:hypothetical protein [Rhodospirillaceae bacterium]